MNKSISLLALSLALSVSSTSCSDSKFSGTPEAGNVPYSGDARGETAKPLDKLPPKTETAVITTQEEAADPHAPKTPSTTIDENTQTVPAPMEPPVIPKPTTIGGVTNDPNTNTTIFGAATIYHVGDGQFDVSSCQQEIRSFALSGFAYHFVFTVEQDNTKIALEVGKLCGVDGPRNAIRVEKYPSKEVVTWAYLGRNPAGNGTSVKPIAGEILLSKGSYAIAVYSGQGADPFDLDDFVVGHISVKADKPIVGSEILNK